MILLTGSAAMSESISLYEAKTHLSHLVERAAGGEEIVITKRGVPYARLLPMALRGELRKPANALHIDHIAEDFDAVDPAVAFMFDGERG